MIYQGSSHFSGFLHHFVLAKLATSSVRVQYVGKLTLGHSLAEGRGTADGTPWGSCRSRGDPRRCDRWRSSPRSDHRLPNPAVGKTASE